MKPKLDFTSGQIGTWTGIDESAVGWGQLPNPKKGSSSMKNGCGKTRLTRVHFGRGYHSLFWFISFLCASLLVSFRIFFFFSPGDSLEGIHVRIVNSLLFFFLIIFLISFALSMDFSRSFISIFACKYYCWIASHIFFSLCCEVAVIWLWD